MIAVSEDALLTAIRAGHDTADALFGALFGEGLPVNPFAGEDTMPEVRALHDAIQAARDKGLIYTVDGGDWPIRKWVIA